MTVPIVPGPGEPEPPTQPFAPPPQVVYVQAPQNPGRVAGNTAVVLIVLVTVFCALPILGCGAVLVLEGLGYSIAGH